MFVRELCMLKLATKDFNAATTNICGGRLRNLNPISLPSIACRSLKKGAGATTHIEQAVVVAVGSEALDNLVQPFIYEFRDCQILRGVVTIVILPLTGRRILSRIKRLTISTRQQLKLVLLSAQATASFRASRTAS